MQLSLKRVSGDVCCVMRRCDIVNHDESDDFSPITARIISL